MNERGNFYIPRIWLIIIVLVMVIATIVIVALGMSSFGKKQKNEMPKVEEQLNEVLEEKKDYTKLDEGIAKKELPKIDDEFVKDVSEFDTLKELKEDIKQKQQKQNDEKAKYETQEAVMKAVCENVKVEIPSGMIETELDNMTKEVENRLRYQGMNMDILA